VGGHGYRDLIAWQKAMDFVENVYCATRDWPAEELYGLTNQVRRAAVSIPANIAEGQGRHSPKEFQQHISIAKGSLHEVETHLLIAHRLRYINEVVVEGLMRRTAEVSRLLYGLRRSLQPPSATPPAASS
jgi:four helix bundle protein